MHNQITRSDAKPRLSIIIPTYNEADNILRLINEIIKYIPSYISSEIIIVDDNSPDNTGFIVEEYARNIDKIRLRVLHRDKKDSLSSAIIDGIKIAEGENILVMDADLSHPPSLIPSMIREVERHDLVIASRYIDGGKIIGWPLKRKMISIVAKKIAEYVLRLGHIKDPLSGFFIFKKEILNSIKFDGLGYKLLLEIIVKTSNINIKEVPYTFTNRNAGESKLDLATMIAYLKSIWRLYRYGRKRVYEDRKDVLFISKAGRFYTVGLSGLGVNYGITLLLSSFITGNYANLGGIITSITSNFLLNKVWTFEDTNFTAKHVLKQYGLYSLFSSIGAAIQLSLIDLLSKLEYDYPLALLIAVGVASIGNFLFNKKFTFKEKIWG